jgi:hypothetical protein
LREIEHAPKRKAILSGVADMNERCRGLDLFLFARDLHTTLGGKSDPDHALLRGLFRQVMITTDTQLRYACER